MFNYFRIFIFGTIILTPVHSCFAADMSVQLTTTDGSTKLSIKNSASSEVASVDSLGNAIFNQVTQTGSGGSFIANQNTLQSGATFNISSGTATNFNTTTLKFADGTTLTTASGVGGGTITGVTAGIGLLGGGTSGSVMLNLAPDSTNYIQNTTALQSGATFYVSSGTATNFNTTTLKFADGTTQTTASGGGTITSVTAGTGLTGGGSSGAVTLNLVSNSTNYVQNTTSLQSGTTFYVSSGTATNLNTTTLKFADGSTQTTASQGGTITGVTAGYGMSGGGTSGDVTINLQPNTTSYVQNTSIVQPGTTFYVSSGTATNLNTTTLKFADGSSQTTAGTITGVTAGTGLSGGGASGNVTLNLVSNSTNYIQNTNSLQAGSTFYVSSGTIANDLIVGGIINGDGSGLTTLNASNLASGTVPNSVISGSYSNDLTLDGNLRLGSAGKAVTVSSNVTLGGASSLTNVPALTASQFLKTDANKNLVSGTLQVSDIPSGSNNYIQNTSSLQSGTTFYVSSGTVANFNTNTLKFTDGTIQTTASLGGSLTGVTAGYGMSGGGTSGNVTVNLVSNSTSYIQTSSTLQSGATFYVSSGTATNLNTTTLKFADGTTQTTASGGGTITSVTAGTGLTGGGSSGAVTLNLVSNSTNYIQNTNSLQSGTTFYVSSGTATNLNTTTLKFADGSSQTTAGTITGVTAGIGLSGGGASGNVTLNLVSNSTNYIQNTNSLQSGTTFYVSSGTATNFNTTTLKFADGSSQTTAGTITGVIAGYGISGGGTSGNVTVNLISNSTSYVQNTSSLQSGSTFYVSSGTVNGQLTVGSLQIPSGTAITIGTVRGNIVPSGTLILTTSTCPSGFTEYTAARGYYLVGVPSGGTVGGTVGSAMTDLSNANHNHTITAGTANNTTTTLGNAARVTDITSPTGDVARGMIAPFFQIRLCSVP